MKKLPGLVFSERDTVSLNVLKVLKETLENLVPLEAKWKREKVFFSKDLNSFIIITQKDLVYAEDINKLKDMISRFIFVSRHESASHVPSLLVHFTGNWLKSNPLGGNPEELGVADPFLGKLCIITLLEKAKEAGLDRKYSISLEATHHGPTSIDRPLTFIEIGSSPTEWNDMRAVKVLTETLIEVLKTLPKYECKEKKVAVGFGGPHYAPSFTKIATDTEIALGHIASRYVINEASDNILLSSLERSLIKPSMVLLDWKGLKKEQRNRLIELFSQTHIELLKTKDVL
ncbi:MAG: D-aminoacyl-tRNA deacylase [Candidatus Njordarchaeales archaeon]